MLVGCEPAAHTSPTQDLAVITALPLFWGEEEFGAAATGADLRAPVIQKLAERYRIQPVDTISASTLAAMELVMVAQPRTLQPPELVALDAWVSAGGKLIIFADPLLDWPSRFPLGDLRRAPMVTLLDPLLDHWGLSLGVPNSGISHEVAVIQIEGVPAAFVNAGQWATTSQRCTVGNSGYVADCRIGKGKVILVGDADLLDARVWEENGTDNFKLIIGLFERLEKSESSVVK
jgi:ABC-type uncharacterized transport system involved in gliding motility auxiliary subunit